MFSVSQKRQIADAVQKILRDTGHPELPAGEIAFTLDVRGAESWSWAKIQNNGAVRVPDVNPWNEAQDMTGGAALRGSRSSAPVLPGRGGRCSRGTSSRPCQAPRNSESPLSIGFAQGSGQTMIWIWPR